MARLAAHRLYHPSQVHPLPARRYSAGAFTTTLTDRYLVKTDRSVANYFTLYFSYGNPQLPVIKGLNFDERQSLIVEPNAKRDTINYWLRDTALVNQDTLRLQVQYLQTDTTGTLQLQTDTLELLSKQPYAKRMKDKQKKIDEWKKAQDKAKRKGKPYEEQMPAETLPVNLGSLSQIDPDQNIRLQFDTPLQRVDTALIHLYSKIDTTWYQSRFRLREVPDQPRTYEIVGEWRPEIEYRLRDGQPGVLRYIRYTVGRCQGGLQGTLARRLQARSL